MNRLEDAGSYGVAEEALGPLNARGVRHVMAGALPVVVVLVILVGIWYMGSIYYNTGYLSSLDASLGNSRAWTHLTPLQQWGQALSTQSAALPAPHQVLANLWSRLDEPASVPGNLWVDLATTGVEAIFGFVCGSFVGLVLSYLFVRSRVLELSLFPYVVMSQTVPIIALVPALVVLLGVGFKSKVLVASYLAFYPVTVSTVKGLRSVDPLGEELMRSYASAGWQTLMKLRFPSALPYLFTGLKIGITASLIGAIVSELPVGSQNGLGVAILGESSSDLNINLWATIVAAGLLGLLMYSVVVSAEKLVLRARLRGV